MRDIVQYLAACNHRWKENLCQSLLHYLIGVILAYRAAGRTPEDAADQIQLHVQRAWPMSRTEKEN